VTVSRNGLRIVASLQGAPGSTGGPLYASVDGGVTWNLGTRVGGAPLTKWWRQVDSSRTDDPATDGMIVMAVDQDGDIFRSVNGGLEWSPANIDIGGGQVLDNWYRLQMSDDGNIVVAVGNTFGGTTGGTGIYVTRNAGDATPTWTKAHDLVADYTAIAMSGDGQFIRVTASNRAGGSTGSVLASIDGGVSFAPVTTLPAGDTNWRAIAMSSDGNRVAVATGLFAGPVPGQLYTSLGNRTETGTLGSVTGGQGLSAVFEYIGNGQYKVQSSSGGAFTIQ
jgi:hypothetical protein